MISCHAQDTWSSTHTLVTARTVTESQSVAKLTDVKTVENALTYHWVNLHANAYQVSVDVFVKAAEHVNQTLVDQPDIVSKFHEDHHLNTTVYATMV